MTLFQAIVLAVVQGVTEFLPISSTAHLILVPWFFGWQDQGLTFDVALHAGTLAAVLGYFARDWWRLLCGSYHACMHGLWSLTAKLPLAPPIPSDKPNFFSFPAPPPIPHQVEADFTLLTVLVISTVPGALAGYFLESYAESVFRSPGLVAGQLLAVSGVMWLADRRLTLVRGMDTVGFKDGVWIGLAQAVAIVPGTSRAGITIAAGLFRNLSRESAARFSFMLATPIIGGATLKKALEVWDVGFPPGLTVTDFVVGVVVSAVVGYAAIAFLLRYLQVRTLKIFVAYRLALGGIILAVEFLRSSP